ncbi:GCN5-related N-acetyltransferase [Geminocystis sp. NIES-3708]|uniref:GNAT family N-acetyltransferase n=1 Tax=Geminocystis sp. NIES-3708 TaxID=1615909 RepID=UPI0005FC7BBC|nr:GNAT family N-acetyltransferase [Geminocystis sp. NIES-3708]BAQ60072.1 GCN5-related N-acetyltransferase [Geminocystis sp. NIES-3708]
MIKVIPFSRIHWKEVWEIIEPVFREGETYPYPPDIKEAEAYTIWVEIPTQTYIAIDDNANIVGTYYLKPNQPGLGSHVCNCGYVVAQNARRQGIASQMCLHSQREAIAHGFLYMQYNLVVSTNKPAIQLWKKQGFEVIGILPNGFRHSKLGLVDALVMYKQLSS